MSCTSSGKRFIYSFIFLKFNFFESKIVTYKSELFESFTIY
ncbi:hypothetical protein LEP1GSC170_5666 [Leptospira interrogans serovar Bataviae str. HAI135]|nr:hypothetical protein LEP1GSC170_5666 [Leptospira interrogans serovar Bataviae str. HAI135]